jgi:hypothetical protein
VELYLYFPMCIHGNYNDSFTLLCHNGEGGGAPYPSHASQTSFDALRKQTLLCLSKPQLFVDRDYNLSEPAKIVETKIVNSK